MAEATHSHEHGSEQQLAYVSQKEIARIRKAIPDDIARAEILADIFRINALYMINRAGSGHIGTSMSVMDIATHLWLNIMKNPNTNKKEADVFFSSKGHDAPGIYAMLIGLGKLPEKNLHELRRMGGLPGHPDREIDHMITNTGSLGMGISKARGMAQAYRAQKRSGTFYVITGDGELQEGQIWESLQPTANKGFGEIVVIVDHNKMQSDRPVAHTSDLGKIEEKFAAFGWDVHRIDGHDMKAIARTLKKVAGKKGKPHVIIADTVKGKSMPLIEKVDPKTGLYRFHSGALELGVYGQVVDGLAKKVAARLKKYKLDLKTELVVLEPKALAGEKQSLIRAHGEALLSVAAKNKKVVAMDADLMYDLGLYPFSLKYPERYVQAGIAEQDMVSFAGGLAIQGMIPVVHSFACFMVPRANEQIYNNASERTKVVYVGGLAGVVPGMPGHSHQSVRDIALMSAIPGLTIIEPADEGEARRALEWAVNENDGSTYIRLSSVPWAVPFKTPASSLSRTGAGTILKEGSDAIVFAYGPIPLSESYAASKSLESESISVAVCDMPWLNAVDEAWLKEAIGDRKHVLVIDDHYRQGGLSERLEAAMTRAGIAAKVTVLGPEDIPAFGQNDEVLAYYKFDRAGLAEVLRGLLR